MTNADDIWAEAIQEAYVSAPADEVILHTIELRHSTFSDPVRLVRDFGETYTVDGLEVDGHFLTLEADAPVQAGQPVLFQSLMFDFKLPPQREGGLPSMEVEIDNVTSLLMEHLDAAVEARSPMEMTYREFLASDPTTPQFVLPGLSFKDIRSNLTRVTGRAQFSDLVNKSFPGKLYRPADFQGLVQ